LCLINSLMTSDMYAFGAVFTFYGTVRTLTL
jgi:molybdopterin synthase catalytic subunit